MQLPTSPAPWGPNPGASGMPGAGAFQDPNNFTEVFLGAFRRDIQSFYPGSRIEREAILTLAGMPAAAARATPTFMLDFQLDDEFDAPDAVRVSLFGSWYRVTVTRGLGLGPRDRDLIRAIGRVMELHHQVLFRWSRVSLLQLRRGMPEDHYVAACVDRSAYTPASSAPSRVAEVILTLRTLALSTYENRRVSTGALILGPGSDHGPEAVRTARPAPFEALDFGVELTGLKSLHRLCDGRRTLFLVDPRGKLADLIDIRRWAQGEAFSAQPRSLPDAGSEPVLRVPCARAFVFHAMATAVPGSVCLVLSPNQEIKVFAGGVQAFVFAHGRWRVLDPESKFAVWEGAVGNPSLARVLFQTALDLAEDRQGGLLVGVTDPSRAIGRLIAPHDVLEWPGPCSSSDDATDAESPARPFSLFGVFNPSDPEPEPARPVHRGHGSLALPAASDPLSKRSIHYLARDVNVTELDPTVLEALAGLDGALVTDLAGRLLAFGAILRHDALALATPDSLSPSAVVEGARTTAALVASRFGPVLKISEDGIVSCFLDGTRVWDL